MFTLAPPLSVAALIFTGVLLTQPLPAPATTGHAASRPAGRRKSS